MRHFTVFLALAAACIGLSPRAICGQASPQAGLKLLADRKIDAFVYDAPLLKYLVAKEFANRLIVLPRSFERQDYAIALPADSPLREPINRALLKKTTQPQWQDVLYRYLGE